MRFRYPGGTDVFFFLSYVRNLEGFYRNIQPYPFLFPLLSAAVKKILKLSDQKLLLIGTIPDIVTGIIAYCFVRSYFGAWVSLATIALFITTPALVYQSTFNPRSLGLLLYSLSLMALTLPFPLSGLSVLFISLTALTHKLSLQTLFFVVTVYSIFNMAGFMYFVLGLLSAFAISKMKYVAVFRFHLSYVKMMMTNPGARYPNKEHLIFANVPYAFLAPIAILALLPDGWDKQILSLLNIPAVAYWSQPAGRLLLVWALIPFLLVFLWRWGDSNRYIIYGSLALALLSSTISESNYLFPLLLLMLLGNTTIALYITRKNTLITKDFHEALNFLAKVLDNGFCCPAEYYLAVKYLTEGKGVYLDSKNPSRIVEPAGEKLRHFRYFILPTALLTDFSNKYDTEILFSNGGWVVGRAKSPEAC